MKKSVIFFLVLSVFALISCERDPYHYGYGYGNRYDYNEDGGHIVRPGDAVVCDEYTNRYNLVNGQTIFVTNYETLVYTTADKNKALQLYWADCHVYVDGYFIYICRYDSKGSYLYRVLDKRQTDVIYVNVLAAYPQSPDVMCTRRIQISTSKSVGYVSLMSGNQHLETFELL